MLYVYINRYELSVLILFGVFLYSLLIECYGGRRRKLISVTLYTIL